MLTLLPDPFAMEVVMRMLRMETVQKEVLDGVERTLRAEFMSNLARSARRDSHELMAEIFNNLDRAAETRFVNGLEERNRESAEKIKSLMFTFDDLQRLSGPAVQILLRSVEKDKLPIALKGASDKIKELFLQQHVRTRRRRCCATTSRRSARSGCATWTRRRAAIVNMAKDLAAQGQIEIGGNSDDEVVY